MSATKPSAPVVDWTGIHRRLEKIATELEHGRTIPSEEKRRILRQRAQDLAREDAAIPAEAPLDVLEFVLSYERYAVELSYVREVCPLKDFASVPGTPRFIFGVVNVRGRIVSVVDLKKFFDLPGGELTDFNKIIVIHDESMEFGLLADSVPGIRQVRQEDLSDSLPTLTGIRTEYLKGVSADRLAVLDAQKLLASSKINFSQSGTTT